MRDSFLERLCLFNGYLIKVSDIPRFFYPISNYLLTRYSNLFYFNEITFIANIWI